MPGTWSSDENDVLVLAYLDLLARELRGERPVKARTIEALQRQVGRSKGSIEFKLANVSAVLHEMHHPWIEGYKPRPNFQKSLRDAVLRHAPDTPSVAEAALALATAPASVAGAFTWEFTNAPTVEVSAEYAHHRRAAKRDYVAIGEANRSLGLAGELAVVALERDRLTQSGHERLAERVEHVSETRGDGLGFDVLSFTPDGREKWIEVKTTRLGRSWPMFVSRNEVAVSQEQPDRFHLYRVFHWEGPRVGLYELTGDLDRTCVLRPETYWAVPKASA